MAKIKGFSFYKSYYECLKDLEKEDKNELINAILEYVFEDKKPKFRGIKKTIWTLIEPNLNTSKNRSNTGSGAPLGNKNASKSKQLKNNQTTINDLYDKDKDKDKDKECVYNDTPHTHTEIFNYFSSVFPEYNKENLEESCMNCFLYYESKQWKEITNWKSKVEQWLRQDIKNGKIKIKQKEEYDTRRFFQDENGLFKYDSEGVKHYV